MNSNYLFVSAMNKEFGIAFIIVILLSSIASTSVFATTRYSTNPDECVDGVCYVPHEIVKKSAVPNTP